MSEFILFESGEKNGNDKAKKRLKKYHPPILRLNLVGESGSGKTQFMYNILFNWYYKYYIESEALIHFFAGCRDTAIEVAEFGFKAGYHKKKQLHIHDGFDLDEIRDIYDAHDGKSPLVFFFDDISYKKGFSSAHKKNFITELYSAGRHKNCSVIVSCQKYMFLAEDCRSLNASHIVLYSISPKENNKVFEENLDTSITRDQFDKITRKHLSEKYSFIVLDKINKKIYDKNWKDITPKRTTEFVV